MLLRIVHVNHIGETVDPNYDTMRMYRREKGLHWHGRIHEQVVFADGPKPMQRGAVRIRLDYWGYEPDVMRSRWKLERNIRLLKEWTKDEPKSAEAWGVLRGDLYVAGRIEDAVDALYRAESCAMADSTYARTPEVRAVLCEALVRLGRLEEARAMAQRMTEQHADYPGGWYWLAQVGILQAEKALQKAADAARKAQALTPVYRGIVSVHPDIPSFLAPVAEADALKMLGNWTGAMDLYEKARQVKPEHEGVRRQIEWLTAQARAITERAASDAGQTSPPRLAAVRS